ncbi:hypothetical protein KSS87_006088 [Heliosperma pusillum]|nr:hypothetical protein KSS87_006088 [Heliosperma pusillum]
MNPFEDACWNVLDDYNNINDFDVSDFYVTLSSADVTTDISLNGDCSAEKGLKRARFSELRKFLNLGSPAKSDKSSILHDAICAVYKLQSEHQELKQRKKKLQDDTLNLKEEKNELREEKLNLQVRKQRIEQQLKDTTLAQSGYMPMQQAIHQGGGHKGVVVSGYGGYPMWQWIPSSVLDISKDHVLRPPVA